MVVKVARGGMAAELGAKFVEAAATHQHDEVELDNFGALPEGIENGIAQITMCKFDKYKDGDFKGKYYFMAQAQVVAPEFVDVLDPKTKQSRSVKISGRYTKLGPEPLCDTPKRSRKAFDEHVAWVQNEMKKLGADPEALGAEQMEDTALAIQQAQPYISFRTWKGKPTEAFPNPRVQETWSGQAEFDGTVDPAAATEDDSGANHTTNGAVPSSVPAVEAEFSEFGDIDSLIAQAQGDEEDVETNAAREELTRLAVAAGATAKQVEDCESWDEVAGLINKGSEPAAEPEKEAWEPKVEQMYKYQPLDPKTGKPFLNKNKKPKAPAECEVTAVSKKNKTVELKSADDEAVYSKVPWTSLIRD